MQTASEILIEARALLADPARWTQNVDARNAANRHVSSAASDAVKWCALGALQRHLVPEEIIAENYLYRVAHRLHGFEHGPAWVNDNLGHVAVLEMYDAAIAEAQAEEAADVAA